MPNRLAHESSPYLLEHAENPVDWFAWSNEAFERATAEQKPVFLSIGYSACHWCHVMERESFENEQIAGYLNEHFVSIKVDREERPDLDQVYMNAVQLMTGHGGWPMSVFLTPDKRPFYGGTYWPPEPRGGMPGFLQVLTAVDDAWRNRRQMAEVQADSLVEHLQQVAGPRGADSPLNDTLLLGAARALERSFDPTYGGFGRAPKFPHPMDLRLLLRLWKRTGEQNLLDIATFTLDKMAAGGIYDQLGGGFHRYSVDERWLVPHFEKMLYDNGLLVPCYVEAFQITGNSEYARITRETCDYLLREMTVDGGGFASTQDADSEGEEGKFFVWTPAEIESVLGRNAAEIFCRFYDVTESGNFEHGTSILNRPKTLAQLAQLTSRDPGELQTVLAEGLAKLFEARKQRIAPHRDDKVLVAWNGLAIEAFALAAGALDEPRYLAAAQQAACFLLVNLRATDGRLLHTWRNGHAKFDAFVDDYAGLCGALISLYEADFDERWIDEAVQLADDLLSRFADPAGGFFYTAHDAEALVARQKDLYDNAVPSGNSLAAAALLRLGKLTGRADYLAAATGTLQAASSLMQQAPMGTGQMLMAVDMYLDATPEIVILGDPTSAHTAATLAELRHRFIPNKLVAARSPTSTAYISPALAELFSGKTLSGPEPAVYVCRNFACEAPAHGPQAAMKIVEDLAKAGC